MKDAIEGLNVRLKDAMKQKGWNQKVLAERSGIHYQQIHKLLSGERPNPQALTLLRLADALDVSIDYLVGRQVNGLKDKESRRGAPRKAKVKMVRAESI